MTLEKDEFLILIPFEQFLKEDLTVILILIQIFEPNNCWFSLS